MHSSLGLRYNIERRTVSCATFEKGTSLHDPIEGDFSLLGLFRMWLDTSVPLILVLSLS